jgi:SAM-dependent methyltransferase
VTRASDWWETYFDDAFLSLYEQRLPPDLTRREVDVLVEILGLGRGSRVLDLGCGWGRHALELAERGCAVVGVDQSQRLLERARARADAAGLSVEWVHMDVRQVGFEGEFDVALSLFSSLGYTLRDEDDLLALAAARRALRPGGVFVLETMHRDQAARSYAGRDWWEGPNGEPVWVEREFDAVEGVSREWLRWLEQGETRHKYHEIRLRSATEWARLLEEVALQPFAWYGGWHLAPFGHRSRRLVVLARPAEAPESLDAPPPERAP